MEDDQDSMEVERFQYLQSPQDHGVIVSHGEVIKINGVNAMGSPALVTCPSHEQPLAPLKVSSYTALLEATPSAGGKDVFRRIDIVIVCNY